MGACGREEEAGTGRLGLKTQEKPEDPHPLSESTASQSQERGQRERADPQERRFRERQEPRARPPPLSG